jgi:hypothetical protein
MQIKIACIVDKQTLFASMSPEIGSSMSITDKSWLNLLTICPASVVVKNESGAFSTAWSNHPWRYAAERGIMIMKSMPVKVMSVTMATNPTATSMPR